MKLITLTALLLTSLSVFSNELPTPTVENVRQVLNNLNQSSFEDDGKTRETSAEVTRYQLKDGIIYYRLNASNYRVTNEKYYTDAQVSMMMRDRATLIHREYHGLLVWMEKEIKRGYDEVEVLETELVKVRGELTAVSTILGQRILKEKAIKEEAIGRRVGCQSSCFGWICTTVF
jgi:hypothetical protein